MDRDVRRSSARIKRLYRQRSSAAASIVLSRNSLAAGRLTCTGQASCKAPIWISHIKFMMEEKRRHHRLIVIENKESRISIPNQVDAALGSVSRELMCPRTATRQRSSQNGPLKRRPIDPAFKRSRYCIPRDGGQVRPTSSYGVVDEFPASRCALRFKVDSVGAVNRV